VHGGQVVHGGQGSTLIGPGMTLARPPVPGATGTYQTIRVQQVMCLQALSDVVNYYHCSIGNECLLLVCFRVKP